MLLLPLGQTWKWKQTDRWGSSATLSWDNSITVIASVNDSVSEVSPLKAFLFSMRWSAHQISNTGDKSTFPKKYLKRSHHRQEGEEGRGASERYRTVKSSECYLPWLPMQSKNTHLKNVNKLDLQCPQRKWEADKAELQKLAMQEREATYDQEVQASGMFTCPSYPHNHSNGGRTLIHRLIQIHVILLCYIKTFIGLQWSSTRGFK